MSWLVEDDSASNTQTEVITSRDAFEDSFKLDKILASNEDFICAKTYVLAILSKEQE